MLSGGILTKSRSSACLESWKSPRSPSETARRRRTGPLPVGLPMFFLNRGASQRAGRPARRPGPSGGGGGEEGGNDDSAVALPNPRLGAHSSGSVFRATAGGSRAASGRRRRGEQQTHTRARHANHSGETRQLSGRGHSTKRRDALARRHKQRAGRYAMSDAGGATLLGARSAPTPPRYSHPPRLQRRRMRMKALLRRWRARLGLASCLG
ncbi:hypothetical protein HPB51_018038 [Rhipicephalus microplus]|uniref:Uncharacterized protein n=1 Tax=Rhipicephalus microplus TaxID=6941 RepID=A0A9J6DP68_RHIMP|nr:hypothetical protein HPB51_018038 [Rhipicephalus microplus]